PPLSFTTTAAPARASAIACSRPSPPPAPVTIATFPSSSPMECPPGARITDAAGSRIGARSGLREEDRPELPERLEAQALVEGAPGGVAFDDGELHVARTGREGLATQIGDTDRGEPAAAQLGPGVDALDQPALGPLHVGVGDHADASVAVDDARALDPAADPAPEALHVAGEGVGPVFLAQALARRDDERVGVGGPRAARAQGAGRAQERPGAPQRVGGLDAVEERVTPHAPAQRGPREVDAAALALDQPHAERLEVRQQRPDRL